MTRDDITRMAREAGINVEQGFLLRFAGVEADLERFAALVAATERNECAALVDANAMACHSTVLGSLLQSNADAIRARGAHDQE